MLGGSILQVYLHTEIQTHLSDQSLLCHHFKSVNYRDVAEPPGNGQSTVPILNKRTQYKDFACYSKYGDIISTTLCAGSCCVEHGLLSLNTNSGELVGRCSML